MERTSASAIAVPKARRCGCIVKRLLPILAALGLALVILPPFALGLGCSAANRRTANGVLDVAQLACIFASELTDESAVAEACAVERELSPVIRRLIAQREAAKRAGVRWDGAKDGARE